MIWPTSPVLCCKEYTVICRIDCERSAGIFIVIVSRDAGGTGGILRSGAVISRHQAVADLRNVKPSIVSCHGQPFNTRCLNQVFSGRTRRDVDSV